MNQKILPNSVFTVGSWALLAVTMAALAGAGIEVFQRHLSDPPVQQFNFGSAKQQNQNKRVSLTGIVNAHIFGTVPVVQKVAAKPKVVEAPETKLNLSLTGVITSPDPDRGRAMIEVQRGQTSVVLVGNEIGKTGAKLNAVFADHILIQHSGALEKLMIERDSLKLDDLAATNAQTVSALNINVAEFEALAEVNPEDLDISKLIPATPVPTAQPEDPDEAEAQQEEADRLEEERQRIEQAERLRQQQQEMQAEQDALDQQQQIQQLQPDTGGAAGGSQQLPEGLKQI